MLIESYLPNTNQSKNIQLQKRQLKNQRLNFWSVCAFSVHRQLDEMLWYNGHSIYVNRITAHKHETKSKSVSQNI